MICDVYNKDIPDRLLEGVSQVMLVTVGYFNFSFLIISAIKKSSISLIVFFICVFLEIILNYFFKPLITYIGVLPLPISIIREIFIENDTYKFLSESSVFAFSAFILANIGMIAISREILVKKDFPRL